MLRLAVPVFVAAAATAAAPVPKEADAERLRRLYGAADFPREGTQYELRGDRLRVSRPAGPSGCFG